MEKTDELVQYITYKWCLLAAASSAAILTCLMGGMRVENLLVGLCWLAAMALLNLLVRLLTRGRSVNQVFVHLYLAADLVILSAAMYLMGGYLNPRWPVIVPVLMIAGYVFGMLYALFYASISCLLITMFFYLEYLSYIPHTSPFAGLMIGQAAGYEHLVNYLTSAYLIYFAGAAASAYFGGRARESILKSEESVKGSEKTCAESERTQSALQGKIEEQERVSRELADKIKEKMNELEITKSTLEQKVAERTRDVEESRKAILHMLKDLKNDVGKLKELDRMKNEFISIVSHELRTPLTPLMDYAYVLLEGIPGPATEKQKAIFESLLRLSKRELGLINSLLDVSRLEYGIYIPKNKPLQISSIIAESLTDLEKEAGKKRITLIKEALNDLPAIMADESLISRLIAQLLNNAMKFTPEGGEIKVVYSTDGANVRCEVKDTGVGLANENLDRIFDKFYQVDASSSRQFGGMGLGLAICRQIVNAHNGKIWAESEGPGKGTSLIFVIPLKT